ncbi:nanos homolog 3-like [Limulus polyphemus]|uniref:Nanos homolog 3-like n=1 Tax=Limulus polyphemus TaxID=6850 RepID=A0ABM1TDU6_LIMPO|nr:nanos homolog 3-like [Limulus polyphemus]
MSFSNEAHKSYFKIYPYEPMNEELDRLFGNPTSSVKGFHADQPEVHQTHTVIQTADSIETYPPGYDVHKISFPTNRKLECAFCKRNGDRKSFTQSHVVRDTITGMVVCPVLRKHRCEVCGATGDNAHTRSYCPRVMSTGRNLIYNTVALKKTPRNSTGKRKN